MIFGSDESAKKAANVVLYRANIITLGCGQRNLDPELADLLDFSEHCLLSILTRHRPVSFPTSFICTAECIFRRGSIIIVMPLCIRLGCDKRMEVHPFEASLTVTHNKDINYTAAPIGEDSGLNISVISTKLLLFVVTFLVTRPSPAPSPTNCFVWIILKSFRLVKSTLTVILSSTQIYYQHANPTVDLIEKSLHRILLF